MTIQSKEKLQLLQESVTTMVNTLETRVMNEKFSSNEERNLMCRKLHQFRNLKFHITQSINHPSCNFTLE
jgi:hypothetical protein